MEWIAKHHWTKVEDMGKLSHYLSTGLVIPIWCPQNSLVVMGGSFPENMIHWTDRRSDMLRVTTEFGLGKVDQDLRMMHSHKAMQTYLEKAPIKRLATDQVCAHLQVHCQPP